MSKLSNLEKKKARQEKILFSLARFGFLSRTQLMILHKLVSPRNTSRVMKDMSEWVVMKRHYERDGEAVYYLNQKGREVVGSEKEMKWNDQVEHYLMRNDLYLYLDQPKDWQMEVPANFKVQEKDGMKIVMKDKTIVPDAMFKREGSYWLVEVDRSQSMRENKKKIQTYGELKGAMVKQFNVPPTIVFLTTTPIRKQNLEAELKARELRYKIFTKEDLR